MDVSKSLPYVFKEIDRIIVTVSKPRRRAGTTITIFYQRYELTYNNNIKKGRHKNFSESIFQWYIGLP